MVIPKRSVSTIVAIAIGLVAHAEPDNQQNCPFATHCPLQHVEAENSLISAPADILSLGQALQLTLASNSQLAAYAAKIRVSAGNTLQASLLPNPELEIELEQWGGTDDLQGFDGAETSVRWNQPVELGGKRPARHRVAQQQQALANEQYQGKRLEILTETTLRFIEVLTVQQQLQLARSGVEVAAEVYQAVSDAVAAGKDAPVKQLQAEGTLALTQLAVATTQGQLKVAKAALTAMWEAPTAEFELAQAQFKVLDAELPALPQLAARLEGNAYMVQSQREHRLASAELASAQAARAPDLELVLGVERSQAENQTTLIAGMAIELPLFNRNQGTIQAAQASVEEASRWIDARNVQLNQFLVETYQDLDAAVATIRMIEQQILPAVTQAFAASQEGYRLGKFEYLDVLDAQRTLVEAQQSLVDATARHHKALVKINQLIGCGLATAEDDHDTKQKEKR